MNKSDTLAALKSLFPQLAETRDYLIAADGAMCTATKDLAATSLPVPTPERMTS